MPVHVLIDKPQFTEEDDHVSNEVVIIYDLAMPECAYFFQSREGLLAFMSSSNVEVNADCIHADDVEDEMDAPWSTSWSRYWRDHGVVSEG